MFIIKKKKYHVNNFSNVYQPFLDQFFLFPFILREYRFSVILRLQINISESFCREYVQWIQCSQASHSFIQVCCEFSQSLVLVGSSVNKFTKQKLEWKLKTSLQTFSRKFSFFPDLVLQPENIYKEKLLHEFRDLRIKKNFHAKYAMHKVFHQKIQII